MITGLKSRISVPRLIVFNETIATVREKDIKEGKDCKVYKINIMLWYGMNQLITKQRDAQDFLF